MGVGMGLGVVVCPLLFTHCDGTSLDSTRQSLGDTGRHTGVGHTMMSDVTHRTRWNHLYYLLHFVYVFVVSYLDPD